MIRHNGACWIIPDPIASGRRGRRTASNGGSECLALMQEVYCTCTPPPQPSARILNGQLGLLWVRKNNWNGNVNRQPQAPIAPELIGSRHRVVELSSPRHFVAGPICAMKLPRKPLKARMVRAGRTPLNLGSSMPPLMSPATLWSQKTAFVMPTSKRTVTPQLFIMSYPSP